MPFSGKGASCFLSGVNSEGSLNRLSGRGWGKEKAGRKRTQVSPLGHFTLSQRLVGRSSGSQTLPAEPVHRLIGMGQVGLVGM